MKDLYDYWKRIRDMEKEIARLRAGLKSFKLTEVKRDCGEYSKQS